MTRANTEHPHGSDHMTRPKAGGEHTDALEHGLPHDEASKGAGPSHQGVGVKPAGHETALEHGNFPEPGEGATGAGGHNHRGLPPPSAGTAEIGGNSIGGGRGLSGKFRGTMGGGASGEGKGKGYMGC